MPARSRIAFVGTGNISGPYAKAMENHGDLELIGAFDVDSAKRAVFAAEHGCDDFSSLDELTAAQPDVVVNLTSAPYHYATTQELIGRGLTVFSEKPLAMTFAEAQDLVNLAETKNARLACAPSLWLADASLAAAERVRAGDIGTVRLVTAEVNQGRIESWHPAPELFYRVGPVFDAGVYPLTYLTAVLGPIRSVTASSATLLAERTTLDGAAFPVETPDAWVVLARFESGVLLRLTCTFYIDSATLPRSVDFHGDTGSIRIRDWIRADSAVYRAPYGEPFAQVVSGDGTADIDWCLGLADLASAVREGRPHRTSGRHAAHVVEVLEAIARSAETGAVQTVDSSFDSPFSSTDSEE